MDPAGTRPGFSAGVLTIEFDMTINARHRKHYKAGSVWKPGEQRAAQERANSWFEKVKELLFRK